MNKPLDTRAVIVAYRAKFDNYQDHSEGGRYFPSPPFKHASSLGATRELLQGMQQALDSGKPMDLNAFARQLNERSAATSQAPASTSAKAATV